MSLPARRNLTRDYVLEQSANLLMERGIANFRLKDLAQSLGVTMPNLYRYFNSREDIVAQSFLYAYQRQCAHDVACLSVPATPWASATDFFRSLRNALADQVGEDSKGIRMLRLQAIAGTMFDEATRQEMARLEHAVLDAATNFIRAARLQGIIPEGIDPNTIAFIMMTNRLGFVINDFTHVSPRTEEDVWAVFEAAFVLLSEAAKA
jgi:AcrR family transcriptional regulator